LNCGSLFLNVAGTGCAASCSLYSVDGKKCVTTCSATEYTNMAGTNCVAACGENEVASNGVCGCDSKSTLLIAVCVPNGLSSGALAAAIAVPVGSAVLIAIIIAVVCICKKKKANQAANR